MDWMNERFGELSTELTDVLDEWKEPMPGEPPTAENDKRLSALWRANNDARNFVVLGDPAVRLAVGPWLDDESEKPLQDGVDISRSRRRSRHQEALERLRRRKAFRPNVSPADAVRAERESRD